MIPGTDPARSEYAVPVGRGIAAWREWGRAVRPTVRARLREHREDLLLSLLVLVVVAAAVATDVRGGSRPPDAFAYLFALGLASLMLVRRSFPLLALLSTAVGIVAYYSAGYSPIGLAVPVAGALYSAAEAGRLRWAVIAATGLLMVSTGFRVAQGESIRYLLGYEFASSAGLMAAAIALGDSARARHLWRIEQRERSALARTERLHEAARQRQQERLRIARDLHDSLAHTTSVISLHTHVAEEALVDDPGAARAALAHVRLATNEAIRELRTTVGRLRSSVDGATEGLGGLSAVIDRTTAGGLPVDVRVEGEPRVLPNEIDTAAYRIVQESLTNVMRHADARAAEVLLTYSPTAVGIRVTDDGRRAGPSAGPAGEGHGILGMQERARMVGGTCTAAALVDGGFRVEAVLPLGEP